MEENEYLAEIRQKLLEKSDAEYKKYVMNLLPGIDEEKVIGVRAPELKELARQISQTAETTEAWKIFKNALPHRYHEENMIHAYLLSEMGNLDLFSKIIGHVEQFLPYVDNWAVCDTINPYVFALHPKGLEEKIAEWLRAEHPYTVRFAIEMLMKHYLDEFFDEEHFQWLIDVSSNEYYVKMMAAWYFATALIKRYDQTVPLLENEMIEPSVHNLTIQKAIGSQRVPYEHKKYLRTLKLKN